MRKLGPQLPIVGILRASFLCLASRLLLRGAYIGYYVACVNWRCLCSEDRVQRKYYQLWLMFLLTLDEVESFLLLASHKVLPHGTPIIVNQLSFATSLSFFLLILAQSCNLHLLTSSYTILISVLIFQKKFVLFSFTRAESRVTARFEQNRF